MKESEQNPQEKSFGQILRDLANSSAELLQSEVTLVKSEMQASTDRLIDHGTSLVIWGGILALSAIPFLAFLVIGLGDLLEGRYWLSSLIVAVVCATVGGAFAYDSFQKFKTVYPDLGRTKRSLKEGARAVKESVGEIQDAVKGENYGRA